MPRARSGIERKYREKARREKKEIQFVHNKMLCEWIKLTNKEMFLQFEEIYARIRTRNPTIKNLFDTVDWQKHLSSLSCATVLPIEYQMKEEMTCLCKDFQPLLRPILPVLTPVELLPITSPKPLPPLPELLPITSPKPLPPLPELLPITSPEPLPELLSITSPEPLPELLPITSPEPLPLPDIDPIPLPEPIPGPDPEPLPSPQPDFNPDSDLTVTEAKMDLMEEISKYITDFDFEVEMHDFECIESFDDKTLEEIGAISF